MSLKNKYQWCKKNTPETHLSFYVSNDNLLWQVKKSLVFNVS